MFPVLRGEPEQLDLDLPPADDVLLPGDNTATLLATGNGAQVLMAGFGLYIGKKGERTVVKQHERSAHSYLSCAQG